ncbi:hypothetical protein V8Z79_12580 [Pantoea dispersa]|uniref:hypothetical protein n=1 Tax=Pantoea dispersa TaxID=59814 RepID=UPI0030D5BDBB
MGRSALLVHPAEPVAAQPARVAADNVNPLLCYLLQPDAAHSQFTAVPQPAAESVSDDAFLLFAADGFAPSAALLQEVATLSHQRPELNCMLVSLAPRALSSGLQSSLQLFQQLQAQRLWQQNNYAVILRAALVKNAAPLVRIQDVMLAGLLNTQTVWLLDARAEHEVTTVNPPPSYQQFMTEYEKVTRLSHFIPERNRYRQSYLRSGLLQLVQQELNAETQFSNNVRHAVRYFSDQFSPQSTMEKLLLKQPDLYFSLMKMRKSR